MFWGWTRQYSKLRTLYPSQILHVLILSQGGTFCHLTGISVQTKTKGCRLPLLPKSLCCYTFSLSKSLCCYVHSCWSRYIAIHFPSKSRYVAILFLCPIHSVAIYILIVKVALLMYTLLLSTSLCCYIHSIGQAVLLLDNFWLSLLKVSIMVLSWTQLHWNDTVC